MLNLADGSLLLMVFIGPFVGIAAAHGHGASIPMLILFGVIGLATGVGFGAISNRMAYAFLRSKRLNSGISLLLYVSAPFVCILSVAFVPFLIAGAFYGHF
jgi:hypothetical protein